MNKRNLMLGVLAAAFALPASAAVIIDPGFEEASLPAEWSATPGLVELVSEAYDIIGDPSFGGEYFTPVEGVQFARLTAGESDIYTTLSQTFTVSTLSQISFSAAFLAFDYSPWNDDAYVRVYNATQSWTLFASNVETVGDFGHTSWASYSSGSLGAGSYTLEAAVRNIGDPDATYSSQLLVDNIGVLAVGVVPEPSTWLTLIFGFGALGTVLRRRRMLLSKVAHR